MPALSRRRALALLAGGGAASLAGCSGPLLGGGAPDCEPRMKLALRETSDEAIVGETDRPLEELHPLARDLVRAARASGSATYDSAPWWPPDAVDGPFPGSSRLFWEPFPISLPGDPHHRFVHLSDGYYRLVVDRVATGETTGYRLVGTAGPSVDEAAESGDSVAFASLPTHDRRAVLAFLGNDATESDEARFGRVWSLGYLRPDHAASSLLVPEPAHDYVGYRDWYLRVEKRGTETVTRAVYELSLAHVADSPEGFADAVKRTDGVVLEPGALSADQRAVLEEATGGAAWACLGGSTPDGDGNVTWVDRDGSARTADPSAFRAVAEAIGDARYVRYDGTWYDLRVTRRL